MGTFRKHRDKSVDNLCADLCIIGLDARVVELRPLTFRERVLVGRGELLEYLGASFGAQSMGLHKRMFCDLVKQSG